MLYVVDLKQRYELQRYYWGKMCIKNKKIFVKGVAFFIKVYYNSLIVYENNFYNNILNVKKILYMS